MSNRLEQIAALVPEGRGVADVGTDHGYVPVLLLRRGYAGAVVATDINSGPLQSAKASAAEAGFSDRIRFVLCDGLSGVEPAAVDSIVVAGMGGDTATGILDRDYWCAAPEYTLILQPMSHQNVLRYWLIHNEFTITRELLVRDSGALYQIFTAVYGTAPHYSDAELFTGKYEQISADPLFGEYLDGLIAKFAAAVRGMARGRTGDGGRLALNRSILTELNEMKGRLTHDGRG